MLTFCQVRVFPSRVAKGSEYLLGSLELSVMLECALSSAMVVTFTGSFTLALEADRQFCFVYRYRAADEASMFHASGGAKTFHPIALKWRFRELFEEAPKGFRQV